MGGGGPAVIRFNSKDIGFFDSFYNNKSYDTGPIIKYIRKDTYFRDILVFNNRIKDVARVKGIKLVRNNL